VVCLQELKAAEPDFPRAAIEAAGYGAVWRGQRSWNGVAILARGAEPILTRAVLPGDAADRQPRYLEAAVGGLLIASIYAPNGDPQPGPKFDYKLGWLERLRDHAAGLLAAVSGSGPSPAAPPSAPPGDPTPPDLAATTAPAGAP
jgi:exodeoxyribonuclease-3